MPDFELLNNQQGFRYEVDADGEVITQIDYLVDDNVVSFTHTTTPPAHRGKGLAGTLTKFALDDLRDRGLKVRPLCSYTAAYIESHPEYQDLVAG